VCKVEAMTTRLAAGTVVVAMALSFLACGGSSPSSPTAPSGTTPATGSHNAGRNCLSCHSFTAAGTAYKSDGTTAYPGVVIRLMTSSGGSGTVVATITADASGNFYTNSAINFGTGLYVTATGTGGAATPMTAAVTSGACNNCHTSGNRIKAN
jgi:mono/diheme cytochrome c family protein